MLARRLHPEGLMRARGIGAYGDYTTPENWIPKSEGLYYFFFDRAYNEFFSLKIVCCVICV